MYKFILTFLISFLSVSSFAGTINGVVKDAANGTPLMGVIVSIKNSSIGTQTDLDGNFELKNVPVGSHDIVFSYVTYQSLTQHIQVKSNNPVTVNVTLKQENTELKEVSVSASKITNTENAVMMEIKAAHTIVSGISAKQIAKTMDRSAADVVKRVPGVTVQDNRFIIIRGLADRYNTVWLNDATAPSAEVDKKSFSFDIIPSGLIDRIMVFKTPSPDLPGDFAGGMVKIYTTSIKDKNEITVGLQTSYNELSTGTNFNYNKRSSTDWLGYDDGLRKMPAIIPNDYVTIKDPSISNESKAFGNKWIINSMKAPMDYRFNLALSNVFQLGKKVKLGNTFGLSYSNVNININRNIIDWGDDTTSKKAVKNYNDLKSENKVNASIMDNLAVVFGNSKIEFKNLYNQIGRSTVILRNSINDTSFANLSSVDRAYSMGYQSVATYVGQLMGTHKSKDDSRKYTWCIGHSSLFKNQPDLKQIKYTQQAPDTVFRAQVPSGAPDIINGGGRYFATLYERSFSFNHQFSQKITVKDNYTFELSAGNFMEYKGRAFNARSFGYYIRTIGNGANANLLKTLPINEIFADSNVGDPKKNFVINENTNPYDKYSAENKLIASYLMINAPVGKKINISGGVRYEYNTQSLKTYNGNGDTLTPKVVTKFWLPSVNVSYNFNEKSLVRLAYGKTLNRPEFREVASNYFYDFEEDRGIYGSLYPNGLYPNGDTLKVTQIDNFDARWEWYPAPGEMIHVGLFYKKFKNPIQRSIIDNGGTDNKAMTFINTDDAYVQGIEIEAGKKLTFLDKALQTDFFKDFTVIGNLTLTKGEMHIKDTAWIRRGYLANSTMQGQSPYIINAGIFYDNQHNGFQGSLLFNVYGPRLYAYGTNLPDLQSVGELPFKSLDFSISKTFFKHYSINFGVQNLLDSKVVFVEDDNINGKFESGKDRVVNSFRPGRYFSFGLKVRF